MATRFWPIRAQAALGCLVVVGAVLTTALHNAPASRPFVYPALSKFPPLPVSRYNPTTVEGVRLGRYLFYDPILSLDSSLSCAGCHKQARAFSDAPQAQSLGMGGHANERNTPPLFNLAWHPSYFWDGRALTLEEQVLIPVRSHDEMDLNWPMAEARLKKKVRYRQLFAKAFGHGAIDSVHLAKALAQFLRTIVSYRSKYDSAIAGQALFTADEYEGFVMVNDQSMADCLHCHVTDGGVLGSTFAFTNNGLDGAWNTPGRNDFGRFTITRKESDRRKFKVPSLRNVALTAPYMHDGRFKTLEEVLDFYSEGIKTSSTLDPVLAVHKGGLHLKPDEKRKIIAFLNTLTDKALATDTSYSNPN